MKSHNIYLILSLFITNIAFGQGEQTYSISNLEAVNSEKLDFSPVPYRDGIMFASTRRPGGPFGCREILADDNFSDLFFARKDESGNFFEPELLVGQLTGKYHDGAATFNQHGTKMFFSRNIPKGPSGNEEREQLILKIYEADFVGSSWKNVSEASFNLDGYSTCHPAMSTDENQIIFSSNRPGGFGGMDLWVTNWDGLGWGAPENLGPKVNTNKNEIFPFIDEGGLLYFSSNGHKGMGGLDLFTAVDRGNGWGNVVNLGAPLNSKKDDFGFSIEKGGTSGYFTSDRKGGKGKDDIYHWKMEGEKPAIANLCVIDAIEEFRIADADMYLGEGSNVPLVGEYNITPKKVLVDGKEYFVVEAKDGGNMVQANQEKSCDLQIPVLPGENYSISINKPGYESWTRTISGKELLGTPEFLIPITPMDRPLILTGIIYNRRNGDPLPLSDVKILNKCNNEKLELVTDHRGEFQMEVDCECDYEIVGLKREFTVGEKRLLAMNIDCESDYANIEIPLEPNIPEPEPEPEPVKSPEFTIGQVIQLDKLHYDYDKYNIRPDAAIELDKVVDLMTKYPSMEIELGSHTDARGSDQYNERLSANRAKSAVNYIISRGISPNRLMAKGYGETQLVNHCANGVECEDKVHEENRRTEIKITAFDEEGVEVKE